MVSVRPCIRVSMCLIVWGFRPLSGQVINQSISNLVYLVHLLGECSERIRFWAVFGPSFDK